MSRAKLSTEQDEFILDRMAEHDLLEVVEIEETTGLSRWGWDAYHKELDNADAVMLVARASAYDERRLYGFVAARVVADELRINNIAVRPDQRRHGLGSALLAAAMELGAQMGATACWLEVRASNYPAQALYKRHGFEIAGRRRNYYREPPEDALIMRAPVSQKLQLA